MSRSWRNLAILLFLGSLLFGGWLGDELLAVSGESQAQLRLYTELLHAAHENYGADVDYRDLVYSSIDGMLRALDPHTSFLSPEDYQDMRERQQGSFFGLGILVSMRDGELTVISPIEGTPAWRLGLRAGDVISTIEGEPTSTMSLDEAVALLKGPRDTQVRVAITRRGLDEPLEMSITRAEIPQTTVRFAYMMTPEIGYIRLTDFSRSTSQEMRDALVDLQAAGMKKLLLDLRSNGGGLLDQTVTVSSYFVPEEAQIVETRGRLRDSYQAYFADDAYRPLGIPVIVLVNNGTASAAEILAGAVQDHDVGLVVGTDTWGKGLVQTVYNLSYGTGLALTTAKYYTPSGRLIQRDYSSYYDYYGRFDEGVDESLDPSGAGGLGVDGADRDVPEDGSEAFATDLGREVYGGGGITPDVVVELPEGPEMLSALFARSAFFEFAVDYANRNTIEDPSWTPPDDMLNRFADFVVAEEIAEREAIDEMLENPDAREYSLRQIHGDIFNSAFGTEASHKILSLGDFQIQTALGLFDEAAALLEERTRFGADGEAQVADGGLESDGARAQ
ncbi:MAG: S41 family peptidase [Acidobacteriota bacterium]